MATNGCVAPRRATAVKEDSVVGSLARVLTAELLAVATVVIIMATITDATASRVAFTL